MAIGIAFTISDAKGDQTTITIPVPDGTALADMAGVAQAFANLLEPLCSGALRSVHFTVPVSFTPWSAALSTSDLQEKARFAFRTVGGFLKHLSIPSVVESIFAAGSRDVDQAN